MRFNKRLVRIHMRDGGPTADGVLVGHWKKHYVLEAATLLESPDRSVQSDGRLLVPRENVIFLQALEP